MNFSPVKLQPQDNKPNADEETEYRKEMERSNREFQKVEVLPRNIGYLSFVILRFAGQPLRRP